MTFEEKNKVIQLPQPKQLLNWLRTLPPGGKLRMIRKGDASENDEKEAGE